MEIRLISWLGDCTRCECIASRVGEEPFERKACDSGRKASGLGASDRVPVFVGDNGSIAGARGCCQGAGMHTLRIQELVADQRTVVGNMVLSFTGRTAPCWRVCRERTSRRVDNRSALFLRGAGLTRVVEVTV